MGVGREYPFAPIDEMRADESARISALQRYKILDTAAEPAFDSIVKLAAHICETPMAALTLIDENRQWFKSKHGITLTETPRDISFCKHTILGKELREIPDALRDPSTKDSPLVQGELNIRFYAGVPLITPDDFAIGTLTVLDHVPRRLNDTQRSALTMLARHAMLEIELRRTGWQTSEKFRVLVESCPLPIVSVGRDGNVMMWNPAAERMFGWKAREVVGKRYPLIPNGSDDFMWSNLTRVFAGEDIAAAKTQRMRSDGTMLDVFVSVAPVRNEYGDVIAAMAIIEDITELTRARHQLERSISLLTATLDSTADAILVVDKGGNIAAYNRKLAELWGLSMEEIARRKADDALAESISQAKDPDALRRRILELRANPEMEDFSLVELKDGRILERYSQPQRIGNEIVGRVYSLRDVSKRVELEAHLRQSQKMEAVGALAGGIAHDFNNLLNIIIGYTSLLMAQLQPDDPAQLNADRVMKAAEKAAGLTRQLLAFSRRQAFRPQVVDLNLLLQDLNKILPRVIPEDVDLQMEVGSSPVMVKADPGQLEQVVMNLAINARDAMPNGGTLRIGVDVLEKQEAGLDLQPGTYARLNVKDTGVGIPDSILPRIFEPFFTTKPEGKGTGLGLATVHGIVRQAGGDITVISTEGKGTSFTILLPLTQEGAEAIRIDAGFDAAARGSETILLVEDNAALRVLLVEVLRTAGYRVLEAHSPFEALQEVQRRGEGIDLIITDIVMPTMRGSELVMRARALYPAMKVLFISGWHDEDLGHHFPDAELLQKPFSPDVLLGRIRTLLKTKAA